MTESGEAQAGLIRAYRVAKGQGLLLDYAGTLVPFAEDPKLARPAAELVKLLRGRLKVVVEEPTGSAAEANQKGGR